MEPAERGVAATLLIGDQARPGTDWAAVGEVAAGETLYREVVVQPALEDVADPWLCLRAARARVGPEGVLTLRSGLPRTATVALLRLAHFQPFQEGTGNRYRARPVPFTARQCTCTVVVPCKNEVGNIEGAVLRLPLLGSHTELMFVDGGSIDGTVEQIQGVIRDHPEKDIKLVHQRRNAGKAAAVFEGFDAAQGDILVILDADLAVAPEDLLRFYLALAEGVAAFANGDRLTLGMESGAMPGANRLGNRIFARVLSVMTRCRLADTLCGTKALFREDWHRLRGIRDRFGGHDPWGDFDLLLGAAALGLSVVDVPIRYHARVAGQSKMRPYRHGLALARTCAAALPSRPWRRP